MRLSRDEHGKSEAGAGSAGYRGAVIERAFEDLVTEAWNVDRSGWDFGWLDGRVRSSALPWDYRERAAQLAGSAAGLLDVDTGGGEFLAALAPLPARTEATEQWAPNVAVARARLAPLGVTVHETGGDRLPRTGFDLILNRHGRLDARSTRGALSPRGRLLTQQVGSANHLELNEALGVAPAGPPDGWTLAVAAAALERERLRILDAREEFAEFVFCDIGAVVFQLRAVSWQVPGFEPAAFDDRLRRLDERIRAEGGFTAHDHRFLIEADRPEEEA